MIATSYACNATESAAFSVVTNTLTYISEAVLMLVLRSTNEDVVGELGAEKPVDSMTLDEIVEHWPSNQTSLSVVAGPEVFTSAESPIAFAVPILAAAAHVPPVPVFLNLTLASTENPAASRFAGINTEPLMTFAPAGNVNLPGAAATVASGVAIEPEPKAITARPFRGRHTVPSLIHSVLFRSVILTVFPDINDAEGLPSQV